MPNVTLRIDGMHCSGCENRVNDRLSQLEGVRSVEVDHEAGTAEVTFVPGQEDTGALEAVVEQLGYDLVDVQSA